MIRTLKVISALAKNAGSSTMDAFDSIGEHLNKAYQQIDADERARTSELINSLPSFVDHRKACKDTYFFANENATEEGFEIFYAELLANKIKREVEGLTE